jgi:hypothetical protein
MLEHPLPFVLALLWAAVPASAQAPLAPEDVPAPLAPWVPWVLDGQTTYGCTLVGDSRQCAWPGELALALDATGGTFDLGVVADRETTVLLPGSAERFPIDVTVDGVARPVRAIGGQPAVRVPAGAHRIRGTLRWRALPEILEVPPTIARVALVLGGERVRWPRREENGAVWLARGGAGEGAEGHFEMEVFRRIEDGAPFRVTTHLAIRASGEPREVALGNLLLAGTSPTELTSDLAVRLAPDGSMSAQVHAGSFSVEVVTMIAAPPDALSPIAQPEPWPEVETWTWVANETLRQVELDGAPSVDPTRTNLPDAWRDSPAYLLAPERTLRFRTTRRGEPQPPPNTLSLSRELWLDLDGEGYTVRDQMSGTMTQGHRLDLAEGELGHVVVAGRDQLITELDGTSGVELRERSVDLRAEWRLPGAVGALPAVAWSEDVQSLSGTLHLPPGYELIAVAGADEAPGSWIDQWNLWGIFFVVLLSLAIGKMFGWRWGAVGALMLTLCYHEAGAPLFTWVFLLVVAALGAALKKGWLGASLRAAFWVAIAILLIVAVPFSADQLRVALFPQTAAARGGEPIDLLLATAETGAMGGADVERAPVATPEAPPAPQIEALEEEVAFDEEQDQDFRSRTLAGRREPSTSDSFAQYARGGEERSTTRGGWVDPNDVIQTGPGVPNWSFRSWSLEWSGPVAKDHDIRLFLLTPWMTRLLSVLRVVLLGLLLVVMIRQRRPRGAAPATPKAPPVEAAAAAGVLALAALFASPSVVRAQDIPDDTLRAELLERLVRPPECAPSCVLPAELTVSVADERVTLDAVVHAGARAGYRVPGPANAWVPDTVTVDGRAETGLLRLDDGFVFLRLEPGVHRVRMEGPIPGRDSLTLAFGDPPRSVEVEAEGWEVEGVRADGRVAESIQLRRTVRSTEAGETLPLTPWLVVTRRLDVGVRWTLSSTVERITPIGTAVVVRVPLLEGESVTDEGALIERGEVVVTLGRDDTSRTWTSVIEPRESLSLTAPAGDLHLSETWTLACSPIWRCTAEGIAPVEHHSGELWEPTYRPWPGETLELAFARPEAAEGQSVTIDRATLLLRPGVRMLEATLETTIRASSGGAQELVLPAEARVQSLTVDGQVRPVQLEDGRLRLTLAPGSQSVFVVWQQPTGLSAVLAAPHVRLGAAAVNARVEITMPDDRWILWTGGPSWGAAVLFWPYLLLVLIVAWLLARTKKTQVAFHDWALLGLGLTQIPAWAALIVVGWFFAIAWRARTPEMTAWWFDIRQLALVGFTFAALVTLYAAVHVGLLLDPEMEIFSPNGSERTLDWYQDRIEGTMPVPWVVSLPLWCWRVLMLGWALWLALRVLFWGRWAWKCFAEGGLWKRLGLFHVKPRAPVPATPAPAPTEEGPPPPT